MAGRGVGAAELERNRQRALASGLRGNVDKSTYVTFDANDYNLKNRYKMNTDVSNSPNIRRVGRGLEEYLADFQVPGSKVKDLSNAPKSIVPEESKALRKVFEAQMSAHNINPLDVMDKSQIRSLLFDSIDHRIARNMPVGMVGELAEKVDSSLLLGLMRGELDATLKLEEIIEGMIEAYNK